MMIKETDGSATPTMPEYLKAVMFMEMAEATKGMEEDTVNGYLEKTKVQGRILNKFYGGWRKDCGLSPLKEQKVG